MKVLFDHQIFSTQTYGGISRYFFELMRQFETDESVDFEVGVRFTNNAYLTELKSKSFNAFFPEHNISVKRRLMYAYNRCVSTRLLKYRSIDLVHPTYYDASILGKLGKVPFILTCHDLIHEKYQHKYEGLNDVNLKQKKLLLEGASAVIAVSENTKKDIVEYYKIPPEKIEVIHLASSLSPSIQDIAIIQQLPEQYLLFVGNRGLYKNFQNYLRAIRPLFQIHQGLQLICAGGGSFNKEELLLIESLKLHNRVNHIAINDAILSTLYHNATAFVFPSLYEGFGIPVVEAFSCGCPALLSNTSSLPEVGGAASLYFDPTSAEDMLQVTAQVIENRNLRNTLAQKSEARASMFTWQKTAENTSRLYKAIV